MFFREERKKKTFSSSLYSFLQLMGSPFKPLHTHMHAHTDTQRQRKNEGKKKKANGNAHLPPPHRLGSRRRCPHLALFYGVSQQSSATNASHQRPKCIHCSAPINPNRGGTALPRTRMQAHPAPAHHHHHHQAGPSQESDSIIIDVEALSSAASSQASAQSLVNVVSCTQTTPSPPTLPWLPVATAESSSFQARSSGSTARWWSLLIEQTRYLDKTPLQCGREQKKAKGEPTLYV